MSSDPFVHSDAAYVLGALSPAETAEFEAHLQTCPACQDRVAQARDTVDLLGPTVDLPPGTFGVGDPVDDLGDDLGRDPVGDEVPPDTLLPGLLRRARREQRRRRAFTASVAGLAAACLAALVVALWPSTASPSGPRPQALHAVTSVSFVTATAALRPHPWGTEIDVRCKYAHHGGDNGRHAYGLRVVDRDGKVHPAGTWTQVDEHTVVFTGGTQVRRERIAKVQVTLADGTPILQLSL